MQTDKSAPVAIYSNGQCRRARLYQSELEARDIAHTFHDIDTDENARETLAQHFADKVAKAPSLVIGGKLYRNPSIRHLDKYLAREQVFDPGMIHDMEQRRFIRHLPSGTAFVSYSWHSGKMILGHIEVPVAVRGSGIGAKFASEVFDYIVRQDIPARATCPFLRRIGKSNPDWSRHLSL